MMEDKKFNFKQLDKLNNPLRKEFQSPDMIWDTLGLDCPEVLVDVGAGTGFFAMPFADKMETGIVYACDTSLQMIQWMVENIPPQYKGKVLPLQTAENRIELKDDIADLVYMINLHHELDDPDKMLAECFRLARPGGTVLIIDWLNQETPQGPPLKIRIPTEVIESQLQSAGFNNVKSSDSLPYHCFVTAIKPA